MPSIWFLSIGCAVLLTRLKPQFALASAIVLVISPIFVNGRLVPDRSKNELALDLAQQWLKSMPQDAILLAESDHLVFPAMYAQEVIGIRPDVVLLNVGFASSRWYWDRIHRAYPALNKIQLAAPSRALRLRRFLLANRDRSQRVESIDLAGQLKIRPCVVSWGLAIGPECRQLNDGQEGFESQMNQWWRPQISEDPIAQRVLARIASKRGQAWLALGKPKQALRSLRTGVSLSIQQKLPIPDGWKPVEKTLNWEPDDMLLTTPHHNLTVGALILRSAGHGEWKTWLNEAERVALEEGL